MSSLYTKPEPTHSTIMCIEKDSADAKNELRIEVMTELHSTTRRCIECNIAYVKGQSYENYNEKGDWKCRDCLRPEIEQMCRYIKQNTWLSVVDFVCACVCCSLLLVKLENPFYSKYVHTISDVYSPLPKQNQSHIQKSGSMHVNHEENTDYLPKTASSAMRCGTTAEWACASVACFAHLYIWTNHCMYTFLYRIYIPGYRYTKESRVFYVYAGSVGIPRFP